MPQADPYHRTETADGSGFQRFFRESLIYGALLTTATLVFLFIRRYGEQLPVPSRTPRIWA